MEEILIYAVVIIGVVSLFVFRNSFIKTHNRSCTHLSHALIMLFSQLQCPVKWRHFLASSAGLSWQRYTLIM